MDDIQSIWGGLIILMGIISALGSSIGALTTIKTVLKKTISTTVSDLVDEKIEEAKTDTEATLDCSINTLEQSIANLSDEVTEFIKKSDEIDKLQMSGLQANARDRINEAYKFYMAQGWIDEHTKFTLNEVASIYYQSGGNSFVKDHMDSINNLPSEPPKPVPKPRTTTTKKKKV